MVVLVFSPIPVEVYSVIHSLLYVGINAIISNFTVHGIFPGSSLRADVVHPANGRRPGHRLTAI